LPRGGGNDTRSDSVIRAFREQHEKLTEDASLFPRQPLILPKLLRVIRHESGNAQTLVTTILEDPGLTADVLKMANSPLYRNTRESVHDIEYAVVMLGIDGLKSLISASIMRPIFQSSNRRDKQTTNLFWESALVSAYIAQRYANRTMVNEAFSAHLLTLLSCTAELIIAQTALRLFDEQQQPLDLETFAYLNKKYRFSTTQQLMRAWGMDDQLIAQLADPTKSPLTSQLSRAQCMGRTLGRAKILLDQERLELSEVVTTTLNYKMDQSLVEFLLGGGDKQAAA
jgi:HD-like signal output (HDOD) protein